jgi:hypothetical protein
MACLQRQDSIVASVMGIDYENWKLIVHADPPPKTLSETRSELASGRFRYLPIGFGDYQELQLSFLLKCQELHVPAAKVPPFEIKTPRKITNVSLQMPPLLPPPYDLLRDTDESWTKKVQVAWSEYSRTLLPRVHRRVHLAVERKLQRFQLSSVSNLPKACWRLPRVPDFRQLTEIPERRCDREVYDWANGRWLAHPESSVR